MEKAKTASKNKYKAQGVWHDMVLDEEMIEPPTKHQQAKHKRDYAYFHSNHEYDVYLALREKFDKHLIKVHYPIVLKPPTDNFKSFSWAIDFVINENNELYFIEAKGFGTREFLLKLSMLDYFFPKFYENLLLVLPNMKLSKCKFLRANECLYSRALTIDNLRSKLTHGSLRSTLLSLANKFKPE